MSKATDYYRSIQQEREAWASQFTRCWLCGRGESWLPLQTHEILSRAQAPNCWGFAPNYFRTCDSCHRDVITFASKELQLAVKLAHDPAQFSLVEMREVVSRINGRPTRLVDEATILEHLRQMRIRGDLCPKQ